MDQSTNLQGEGNLKTNVAQVPIGVAAPTKILTANKQIVTGGGPGADIVNKNVNEQVCRFKWNEISLQFSVKEIPSISSRSKFTVKRYWQ